jgi:GNAT superfamily N-acetyltransferase
MHDTRLRAVPSDLARVQRLRDLFLFECHCQVRYNACHERGWSDSYILACDGREVGYGAVKGDERTGPRDTVFEFYVVPPYRRHQSALFRELLSVSGATRLECQSNDPLLAPILFEFCHGIRSDVVLFESRIHPNVREAGTEPAPGSMATAAPGPSGAVFRRRRDDDDLFHHDVVPMGDFVVQLEGAVVATGGWLLHYNPPFADVYMEVEASHRRRGIGAWLVRCLMTECYLAGRVPAARCNLSNAASRSTLTRAGMRTCGCMLVGEVRRD